MVKSRSGDGTSSVAPFLLKCYEMVDDESNKKIVSWSATNNSFIIFDETQFSLKLLPKYWKHNNFSSFIRQLNIYGFRKVDADRWEFANEGFIRGQKHLLRNITRRKNSLGLDQRKSSEQKEKSDIECKENENLELWKEVENLKIDRNALRQELVKLRQQLDTADNRLVVLRERLQGMEKNQQQMMSFIVMAMQSPGFFVQLLQPIEHNWRPAEAGKKNILQVMEDGENLGSDGMIVNYQPPTDKTLHAHLPPQLNPDTSVDFDIPDGMKDFLANSELMQTLLHENCSLENSSPLILPDLQDDGLLDQLLLSGPFLGNIVDNNMDSHEGAGPEMESHQVAIHSEQVEKYENCDATAAETETEKSLDMDLLIEQVGHLASDTITEGIEKRR